MTTESTLLRCFMEFSALKHLPRAGWLLRGVPPRDCESVAAHGHSVTMLAALLLPGRELNAERVLRMALIHDLGEARIGDITPSDGVSALDKHRREAEAVRGILGDLPGANLHQEIWDEYEAGQTPEARFVRQVDKLEMALQAARYRAEGHDGLGEFFESARAAIEDPELLALVDAADTRGLPRRNPSDD